MAKYGTAKYGFSKYGISDDPWLSVLLEDVQREMDAAHKHLQWVVLIDGTVTDCLSVTTRYGVNEPVGTATLSLPLPLPSHVTMGASVEVQAGFRGAVHTIFRGFIPRTRGVINASGKTATVTASSWAARLARKDYVDVVFPGPISLKALFEGLCRRRRAISYRSDATTSPDGSRVITLGNNEDANGREVLVPRKTQTLDFLTRTARLFGYRAFDTPGEFRQKRISGMPNGDASIAVLEAWNAIALEHETTVETVVNYREVFGAEYTDADGVTIPIRSIPAAVPDDPILQRIWGEGWTRDELSDEIIDEYWLADIVRNVAEIDYSEPQQLVAWETHGAPGLNPGDVVTVESSTLGVSGLQWLMRVQHTINERGFTTRCEGWRGSGTALPAGEDCITTPIPGGPWHVGDEVVPWYAVPSPGGKEIRIPFTVSEYYSSLAVYGLAHGSNSQMIGGVNTDIDVSRFEIWQFGEQVGSGNLPIIDENYARQLPYGSSDDYWQRIAIPIGGHLEPGQAELRILSGENRDLPESTKWDDFEVKSLSLRTCGVGEPILPMPIGG